jgi:hypothetical protein
MADISQNIETILLADLMKIVMPKFGNTMISVSAGFKELDNVTDFPSACIYDMGEDRASRSGVFKHNLNTQYAILVFFSNLNGTLESQYKSLKKDLKKLIHSTDCTLNKIPGITFGNWLLSRINPWYDFDNNRGFVGSVLTIHDILEDSDSNNYTLPA